MIFCQVRSLNNGANAAGHFVWGMSSNCVNTVIVDGKIILENRTFLGLEDLFVIICFRF